MSALRRAIDTLNERTKAMADIPDGEQLATMTGNPNKLIRAMVSGFLPVDEIDETMTFLGNASKALQSLVFGADSPVATDAGVRFTIAQMLVVGAAVEREKTVALVRVERAARRYVNEFDHLLGGTQYVERQELRDALAAVPR